MLVSTYRFNTSAMDESSYESVMKCLLTFNGPKDALVSILTTPSVASIAILQELQELVTSFLPSIGYYKHGNFQYGSQTFSCEKTIDELKVEAQLSSARGEEIARKFLDQVEDQ